MKSLTVSDNSETLRFLIRYKSLTSIQLKELTKSSYPPARIRNLVEMGVNIISKPVPYVNRRGKRSNIAQYTLATPAKEAKKVYKLAQAFSDVSLGTFYTMLEYKANWNDKTVVKIDRFFPSSKTCNVCNYINQDLTLKDREWTCLNCNTKHDRDFNASINIKKQGLKILSCGSGTDSDIKMP